MKDFLHAPAINRFTGVSCHIYILHLTSLIMYVSFENSRKTGATKKRKLKSSRNQPLGNQYRRLANNDAQASSAFFTGCHSDAVGVRLQPEYAVNKVGQVRVMLTFRYIYIYIYIYIAYFRRLLNINAVRATLVRVTKLH